MAANRRRVVQHGVQLLEILVESLQRLELELQGETPGAPDLWNEVAKNCFRPKDEMRLSDYVKRHYEQDIRDQGIIVNREVQIRQAMGNNPGEQTDIHVDAISKRPDGSQDRISAIIEVKGCWHAELSTAMQTQLRDRYLCDNASPTVCISSAGSHVPNGTLLTIASRIRQTSHWNNRERNSMLRLVNCHRALRTSKPSF